jgi:hypothetical protein
MKNPSIRISNKWTIEKDEFHEIDPLDDSIEEHRKYIDLYIQEDLLLIKNRSYHLDLGWYGGIEEGYFGLYLFRGNSWHSCELLEKRQTKNYNQIIDLINELVKNVDLKKYDSVKTKVGSIDDYMESKNITVLNNLSS